MGSGFLKTVVLLTALTVLFVLIGRAIGGTTGMVIAFLFAVLTNFFAYWYSDQIVLRMSGAQAVAPEEAPGLYRIVDQVAQMAGLPRPRVYVMESDWPNAFATGRDPRHAAIAVTTGIRRILNERELAAVIAHELGHVKNRDTLIMTIVATLAGGITMLAQMGQFAMTVGGFGRSSDDEGLSPIVALLMIVVAPIAAMFIQLAISRAREFEADATGAAIGHDPLALASALEKLEAGEAARPLNPPPATAHLFIVNPFRGSGVQSLFMTHPPIPERVARLRTMAAGAGRGA